MRSHLRIFLFCLAALPALASAEGEVYRWKDANGQWHYSDQPQPGAELVKARRASSPAPAAAPRSTPAAPAASAASAPGTAGAPASAAATEQVNTDVAAARAEQCKKAKENYGKTVQARRMYKLDEKGERVFLTDKEIDEARLNALNSINQACGEQAQ